MKMAGRVLLVICIFFTVFNGYEFLSGRRQTVKTGRQREIVATGGRVYAGVEWGEDFMKAIVAEKTSKLIQINQLGYRPQDRKVAVIDGHGGDFFLVRVGSRAREDELEVVYTGATTEEPVDDGASGARIYYADFSQVTEDGHYFLYLPGVGKSYPFRIDPEVYRAAKKGLLKMMYYQRCGIALEPEYAGVWSHKACHLNDAFFFADQKQHKETTGGWHDAGDFGKYTVPVAVTLADLLLAYELFPEAFCDSLQIPESGNGIPDILDECRYALDWLLKMQDPATGGVYHKVSTKRFPGFIMPEADRNPRYITEVSPTATGGFAAIMAAASRIYSGIDPEFANRALAAAEKAWQWLEKNPNAPNFKNPAGMDTGEYGDWNNQDERFWAAVELYRATGRESYHNYVLRSHRANMDLTALGWQSLGGFGAVSYLFMDEERQNERIAGFLRGKLLNHARVLAMRAGNDGYGLSLTGNDYYWGSNGLVMQRAMILIIAHLLAPEEEYVQVAQDHLHYLFGRNVLGKCYVTGFGGNPVMNPHHRPSGAGSVKAPVPGMVAGGPNSRLQDPTAQRYLRRNDPPARAYIDHQGSWSTNEVTTYWNSPAVFVTAYFDR